MRHCLDGDAHESPDLFMAKKGRRPRVCRYRHPCDPKPNVVMRSNQVQCSWAPFQLQALHSTVTPLNSFGKIRAFGMA